MYSHIHAPIIYNLNIKKNKSLIKQEVCKKKESKTEGHLVPVKVGKTEGKRKEEAGELAWLVKCMLCKHENPSKEADVVHVYNPSDGGIIAN